MLSSLQAPLEVYLSLLPSPSLLPHQVLLLSVLMVAPGPFPAFPPDGPLLGGWGPLAFLTGSPAFTGVWLPGPGTRAAA